MSTDESPKKVWRVEVVRTYYAYAIVDEESDIEGNDINVEIVDTETLHDESVYADQVWPPKNHPQLSANSLEREKGSLLRRLKHESWNKHSIFYGKMADEDYDVDDLSEDIDEMIEQRRRKEKLDALDATAGEQRQLFP